MMRSVRSRLFGMLVIFIILPYFLSVFIIYDNTRSSVEEHEIEKSREELEEGSRSLQRYFDEMIELSYSLYNDPDVLSVFENGLNDEQRQPFERSMKIFSISRPEIRQMRIYFEKDSSALSVYQSKFSAPKKQEDYVNQAPFRTLYESDDNFFIERPHVIKNANNAAILPESDRTRVLTIHHKVTNVLSGEFLGFISMDIDVTAYSSLILNLSDGGESRLTLLDGEDRIMYSSQRLNGSESGDEGDKLVLEEKLKGNIDGWRLVKVIDRDVLFRDVNQAATTNILLGIGVVLLGIIMVVVISHIITKPIEKMSEKVRSIGGENMDVDFTTSRKDELGHLEDHMDEMMDRINQHIDREYKLEIESRKNQFRALRSQVNPHFLFNALQTIGAVALKSGAKDVYKLITSLSKMMRYSLRADQWVTVQEEIDYIETYLSMQRERFGEGVHADIEVDAEVRTASIPSMLLQPLVENYFKHSYEEGYDEAPLSITGERVGGSILFTVQNTGASISDEDLGQIRSSIYGAPSGQDGGIGLKNIYDRLRLNFKENASFQLNTLEGRGFRIVMKLPFMEDKEEGGDSDESTDRR
ncbi:sensor histidine kinase [Rossellomorea marisflavi]|uniref:sensor histidine kinase n=1 Tax=Rossellomorea marisflavi TaxID=189381 RepID=UPI003F9FD58E